MAVSTESAEPAGEPQAEDDDKVYPGVAIWAAFSVPVCLIPQKETELLAVLQTCGFSILECKVINFPSLFVEYKNAILELIFYVKPK